MHRAFICIGSNIGDRAVNISSAVNLLKEYKNISLVKISALYETKPFGVKKQPDFYNCALEIDTDYTPEDLLMILKSVEKKIGRKETFEWGPREIDLDLVLFGKMRINNAKLKIPHPGIYERDFFLVPLLEIDENLIEPNGNKKLKDYLKLIETNHIIRKIEFDLNEIINGS